VQEFIVVFIDIMLISNFDKTGPALIKLKRVDETSDKHARGYIRSFLSR
jgi:hypothetical protein